MPFRDFDFSVCGLSNVKLLECCGVVNFDGLLMESLISCTVYSCAGVGVVSLAGR